MSGPGTTMGLPLGLSMVVTLPWICVRVYTWVYPGATCGSTSGCTQVYPWMIFWHLHLHPPSIRFRSQLVSVRGTHAWIYPWFFLCIYPGPMNLPWFLVYAD